MTELNDVEVVLAQKKLASAAVKNQKQTQLKKIKTASLTVYYWTEKETNNWEWDFRGNSLEIDFFNSIRDSVLLNSLESFLVTLPSISSETWEMYSWALSGSIVFRDWVILVFSGVSLETAAKFLLFLKFAMTLREKLCRQWRLNWSFYFIQQWYSLPIMREKGFKKMQTVWYQVQYNTQRLQFIKKQKYFHFSYIYLSLAGNIIVYTPNQGTNRKK